MEPKRNRKPFYVTALGFAMIVGFMLTDVYATAQPWLGIAGATTFLGGILYHWTKG